MKKKTFNTDDELMDFISNNNIQVISTHTTPTTHIFTTGGDYSRSVALGQEVTLLYIDIETKEKVMI